MGGWHVCATKTGNSEGILMRTKAMAAGFTPPPQNHAITCRVRPYHAQAYPTVSCRAEHDPTASLAAKSIGTARTSLPASDGCTTLAEPVSTKPRPAAPCLTLPHQAAPYRASPHRALPQRLYRRCAWNLPKRGRQSPRPTSAPAILNQPDTVAALTTESSY